MTRCGWSMHRGRPECEVAAQEQDPGDVDQAREEGEAHKAPNSREEADCRQPAGKDACPPSDGPDSKGKRRAQHEGGNVREIPEAAQEPKVFGSSVNSLPASD